MSSPRAPASARDPNLPRDHERTKLLILILLLILIILCFE